MAAEKKKKKDVKKAQAGPKKPSAKKTPPKKIPLKSAPTGKKPAGSGAQSPAVKGKEAVDAKKEALRKELLSRRQYIIKEAKTEIGKYIKGENRQLVETALDDGDWSVIDLSEDIVFQRLGTHKDMLFKIDEAIRKLREGTYGICEDCGDEIQAERLKVLPFAIYCRDCQERREIMAAMEKE